MKTALLRIAVTAALLCPMVVPSLGAEDGPRASGQFQGRIAYSCDGNHNDPDDWIASAMSLAILAEAGLKDRLVHFDYNCILPQTNPEWEKTHAESVLGAAERYGFDKSVFYDCRKQLDAAISSIAQAVNNSSENNPLYFIIAGPVEVPYLGLQKANPGRRPFVYCISHSRWNDGFASKYKFTLTKRSVIEQDVHWVQIGDQNRLLSTSPYGRAPLEAEWRPYYWMRDSRDPRVTWLWDRMLVSTRPDPSDAGMTWFLLAGDEKCDLSKLERLINDHQPPSLVTERTQVRIEAENFRHLEGFVLEDRNDRDASHRLNVKVEGAAGGRIRTQFNEPFTSDAGRYDVELRYLLDPSEQTRLCFLVNGVLIGPKFRPSNPGGRWATYTIPGVTIKRGDELVIEAQTDGKCIIRLDYVQLNSLSSSVPAKGPLRVHPENPRYFTDGTKGPAGSLKAVYLTGSHHWNNLQDSAKLGKPLTEKFDYEAYLEFLARFNHNYLRMWAWEVGENDSYYEPAPWVRSGSGTASDGKPKFDLKQFNPEYFKRLRSRIVAARDRGIYVGVMLFQGWSIYSHGYGNPWPIHPFNKANNINGIDGDADHDGEGKEMHTLQVPAATRLQEAYVRKVIDTVNDLDNVFYEISNETAIFSRDWQCHMVTFIKECETAKPKQHPVGMTAFDSGREGSMAALLDSPADWISPQNDGTLGDYDNDPPAAEGRKVILSDTDHIYGIGGDQVWVWKSFTRGLNTIYMDSLSNEGWKNISVAQMEGARRAMGQTRTFAEWMNLAAMTPRPKLASTRYCLANPGTEYLVYQPKGGDGFSVELSPGTYHYEWFNPANGQGAGADDVAAPGGHHSFKAPFPGDAVLYLQRVKE